MGMNDHYIYGSAACALRKQPHLPAESWMDLITSDIDSAHSKD